MKKNVVLLFIICTLGSSIGYALEYVPGEVIIKMKNTSDKAVMKSIMSKASADKGMKLKQSFEEMNVYHYELDEEDSVENAISELELNPDIDFVEPNYIVNKATFFDNQVEALSADQLDSMDLEKQTSNIGLPIKKSSRSVSSSSAYQKLSTLSTFVPVVAVIDTGLDINHDVFVDSGAVWVNSSEIAGNGIDDDGNGYIDDVNGWNYIAKNGLMIDDEGHGTHVSGIVLSAGMDIFTTPYESSPMQIMPLKFLDSTGSGKTSDAISAIYYAVNNGANVINNSWGGSGYSASLHEAITYSYENGVVFTAAAGNSGTDNDGAPLYPANYDVPHVMSIAATTSQDDLATFSNFGISSVDIGSPGVYILSTLPCSNGYCGHGTSSGTSMATPFVSGVAAMMILEQPAMLPYQVKTILFDEADYISDLNSKVYTESRINGSDAVSFALTATLDTTQPAYTFSADRSVASADAAGCGLVKKMYDAKQAPRAGRGGGSPVGFSGSLLGIFAIFLAPFLVAGAMRKREETPDEGISRRKFDRFKVDSEVSMNINGEKIKGSISCISTGGAAMSTQALLEKGGVIKMVISSPDGSEQVEVSGEVVWEKGKDSYGVKFENMKDQVKDQIGDWTKTLDPEAYNG